MFYHYKYFFTYQNFSISLPPKVCHQKSLSRKNSFILKKLIGRLGNRSIISAVQNNFQELSYSQKSLIFSEGSVKAGTLL